MSNIKFDKADFFISYTNKDKDYAEWIAWQLEDNGYTVVIQSWDFLPGANFINEMETALEKADKMIAVMSEAYFDSGFSNSEWSSAFSKDPEGIKKTLIPIRIENFDLKDLARPRIYIDLVGCDEEIATERLLKGIKGQRLKPLEPPMFPGLKDSNKSQSKEPKSKINSPTIPTIKKKWTDKEKNDFLKDTMKLTQHYFLEAKEATEKRYNEVSVEIDIINNNSFIAEIYLEGALRNNCKIWINKSFGSNSIAYTEGMTANFHDHSFQENISVCEVENDLYLDANLSHFTTRDDKINYKQMSQEQAAQYLWNKFSASVTD